LLKNQLCFTLKIRSGTRTPFEVTCDPLSVNDQKLKHRGFLVSASTISRLVTRWVSNWFREQNKEISEAVQTSNNSGSTEMPPIEEIYEALKINNGGYKLSVAEKQAVAFTIGYAAAHRLTA